MIPGTALPATRLVIDDTVQQAPPTKAITDILSEFSPGQRLQAVIQGQHANGTYRAIIAQRDVTLALPFAAKAGDALELEVVEAQGRLTLAVVAKPGAEAKASASATATLSQTARVIGGLLAEATDSETPPSTRLNAGQALTPTTARIAGGELAPALQRAVTTSGLFYESHQAAWVTGKVTRDTLMLEPQGRLPPTLPPLPSAPATPPAPAASGGSPSPLAGSPPLDPAVATLLALRTTQQALPPGTPAPAPGATASPASAAPSPGGPTPGLGTPMPTPAPTAAGPLPGAALPTAPGTPVAVAGAPVTDAAALPASAPAGDNRTAAPASSAGGMPVEVRPLVQQQLTALASNVYAFHGQAWPGQEIYWEIVDDDAAHADSGEATDGLPWQTRLRLSLPSLGAVDARLRLHNGALELRLISDSDGARSVLRQGLGDLRAHLDAAGVPLATVAIDRGLDGKA